MTYRNRKMLDLAEGKACVSCGADNGTIVAAHLAKPGESGTGHKGPDWRCAWLCARCHGQADRGHWRRNAEWRACMVLATLRRIYGTQRLVDMLGAQIEAKATQGTQKAR